MERTSLLITTDETDELMTNVTIATSPALHISPHFQADIPADPNGVLSAQSITINLPSTHYLLYIKPTLARWVLGCQYKLFVTSGSQRLSAMATIPGHAVDQQNPLFETRISPGVSRIEVEIITSVPNADKTGFFDQFEKITFLAHLLKASPSS